MPGTHDESKNHGESKNKEAPRKSLGRDSSQKVLKSIGLPPAFSLLKESISSVPSNVYALGVVGIVAAAAICLQLMDKDWLVSLSGGVAVFIGMVVVRIFANPTQSSAGEQRSPEAVLLGWLGLAALVVVLSFLIGKLYLTLFPASQPNGDRVGKAPAQEIAPAPGPSIKVGKIDQQVDGKNNTTTGISLGNSGTSESKPNSPPSLEVQELKQDIKGSKNKTTGVEAK
jgi:hypothetical protein